MYLYKYVHTHTHTYIYMGFPDNSVGKEPACNAGDPGSILGSGRSTGKGLGYPFQYSWVSLVAQLVKNPPTVWETCVRSLGWEDPLEKGKATHSTILVMPSNYLILGCPFLLPLVFPRLKVFSNELAPHVRWPKYWSFSISPSNEYSGLISFRID